MKPIRKIYRQRILLTISMLSLLSVVGCKHDFYESGDSTLSYLQTEFAEVTTDGTGNIVSALTDNDVSLTLNPPIKRSWAKENSVYRTLLYYNKVENNTTEAIAIEPIPILQIRVLDSNTHINRLAVDPLTLQSAWVSKNKKYLNLGLILKTGSTENTNAVQSVGVVQADKRQLSNGRAKLYLVLYHNHNEVPEYYSSRIFASIPLSNLSDVDSIYIDFPTKEGIERRGFRL